MRFVWKCHEADLPRCPLSVRFRRFRREKCDCIAPDTSSAVTHPWRYMSRTTPPHLWVTRHDCTTRKVRNRSARLSRVKRCLAVSRHSDTPARPRRQRQGRLSWLDPWVSTGRAGRRNDLERAATRRPDLHVTVNASRGADDPLGWGELIA
jgi:hypothetical protein